MCIRDSYNAHHSSVDNDDLIQWSLQGVSRLQPMVKPIPLHVTCCIMFMQLLHEGIKVAIWE
eukprot:10887399-Prorocentrum_lima.AAC.1